MKTIDLRGNELCHASYPFLSITWHRSEWGTYCHKAFIEFESNNNSDVGEVTVTCKIGTVGKDKKPVYWEKREAAFLTASKTGNVVKVPLNSSKLIEAISLNDWTKSTKTKNRMLLLGRAVKLEWEYAGEKFSYDFMPEDNYSPAMLCEHIVDSLSQNEKTEIRIVLSVQSFNENLFDL